jgi:hypothetical protein
MFNQRYSRLALMYIGLSCSRNEEKCHSVDPIQAELISKVLGVFDMCKSHFPFFDINAQVSLDFNSSFFDDM